MRKLRLNVEELVVDSFVPTARRKGSGTVRGNDSGYTDGCTNVGWTCGDTCFYPCVVSVMTDCHRCTQDRSDVSICPDEQSACICG